MKKKILSAHYWKAVIKLFLIYLPLYFLVSLIADEKEAVFTFARLTRAVGNAVLMALVFAYFSQRQLGNDKAEDETLVEKPGVKSFLIGLLVILCIATIIVSILLVIGWLIIHYFSTDNEPFFPVFVRGMLTTLVMCFFLNCIFFLSELWQYKAWQKKRSY